jgi:hypothetical protein
MTRVHSRKRLLCALAVALLVTPHLGFVGNELKGRWSLSITIPDAPDSATTRTFTVTMDVIRAVSLHGRANLTDEAGRTIGRLASSCERFDRVRVAVPGGRSGAS